jgi:hypothetical protein
MIRRLLKHDEDVQVRFFIGRSPDYGTKEHNPIHSELRSDPIPQRSKGPPHLFSQLKIAEPLHASSLIGQSQLPLDTVIRDVAANMRNPGERPPLQDTTAP